MTVGYGKATCRNRVDDKKCKGEWKSVTQLRKVRSSNGKAECPECHGPLTKAQAIGRK